MEVRLQVHVTISVRAIAAIGHIILTLLHFVA